MNQERPPPCTPKEVWYALVETRFILAGAGLVVSAALLVGQYISSGEFVGLTLGLAGAYITANTVKR